MTRVIGGICLAVFLASLAVHVASYALVVLLPVEEGAGFLHLAVLLACLLAVLVTTVAVRRLRWMRGCTHEQARQAIWERVPRPAAVLAVAVFLYAWGVMAWRVLLIERGQPRQEPEGSFVLRSHGHVLRPLSHEEYVRLQAYELRAVSALWMSFSLWANVFVWSLPRGGRRNSGSPVQQECLTYEPCTSDIPV